jgi:hypothetical protein
MHIADTPEAKVALERAKEATLKVATALVNETDDGNAFRLLWRLGFISLRELESHRVVD